MKNPIQKQLGSLLFNAALFNLRDYFKNINPRKVNFGDIDNILKANGLSIPQDINDIAFSLTTWPEWLDFLSVFKDKLEYVSELWDCDDYAEFVQVMSAFSMLINTAGKVHCTVYNADTGALIAGHFCNLILTSDNQIYIYDLDNYFWGKSGNSGWTKYNKSQKTIIGNWEYRNFDRVAF